MGDTLYPAIASGGFLLLLVVMGYTRWRGHWAILLLALSLVSALYFGALGLEDTWKLPQHAGLQREVLLLLVWGFYGSLVRTVGFPTLGPPWLVAPVLGALIGELGAAAAMGAVAEDRSSAARLALAASGGALLGRVGDPSLLLLADRMDPWVLVWLVPLALACIAVSAPWRAKLRVGTGDKRLGFLSLAVAVGALFAPLWALALGVVLAAAFALRHLKDLEWREPLWVVGSMGLALVAVSSGAAELVATGLELGEVRLAWVQAVPLALVFAVLSALIGAPATAFFAAAMLDRALDVRMEGVVVACAVGTAVGPLGPLVVAGALRKGLLRWMVQVLLGLAWVWAWTRWH